MGYFYAIFRYMPKMHMEANTYATYAYVILQKVILNHFFDQVYAEGMLFGFKGCD